jgi:hypothetical protein
VNQLTRRQLFRLAGGGLALAATNLHRAPALALAASGAKPARNLRGIHKLASPVRDAAAGQPFNTLLVSWQGGSAAPASEICVLGLDGAWGAWLPLHPDHHVDQSTTPGVHFNPVFASGSAFRIRADGVETSDGFHVITINTADGSYSEVLGIDGQDPGEVELVDGFIIPRAAWGANEAYRHLNQDLDEPVGWPPRYKTVERVVVHHTETGFGWDDPAAVVRSIYYYHAIVLEWTDIGYNFLIDMYGNVYEGRYGGPNVIGGHALAYNPGSLGVALIGSFIDTMPSEAALDSLARLIATRAGHVDPAVAADWLDWADMPNICGHGDVMNTLCPGANLHGLLPALRGRLAGTGPIVFPPPVLLYDPRIISFSADPETVSADGLVEIRATITNLGRDPLVTQGPAPGFVYDEGEDFDTAGFAKLEGSFRLAVSIEGEDGIANPYRWGLGAPLANGEEREIVGYIRLSGIGTRRIMATLVREFVRYYDEEEREALVHVPHPLVGPAAPDPLAGARYVPETGHNVPAPFAAYWDVNGGLQRFGYPLTEPFDEVSATDGKQYLTQYFERARFEYHPEFEGTKDAVQLGLLGRESVAHRMDEEPFRPIAPFASTSELVYFPETGHSTSYRFLESWSTQGGVPVFGFPISAKFEEVSRTDGKVHLIQYFERARFEYHPDDAWDRQIKLGHLGRELLIDRGWLPGG